MNTFSEYSATTGLFSGAKFTASGAGLLDMNLLGDDISLILGEYDHLSQRVDLETGTVTEYQPPSPGASHQWNPGTKRWIYVASNAEELWGAQDDARRAVNFYYSAKLADVRATYPPDEVTSWAKQESEACAWTANNAAPTPLLSAIAAARGVPFALLVSKVIEKADLFAAASGALIGARQKCEDQIAAAADPAAVEAVIAELVAPS
jgi:hypothetical protein